MKTYSAQSGFVYQYFCLGFESNAGGVTYTFAVKRQRDSFDLSVRLEHAALTGIGRPVEANEQYAIAKMTLFSAFDELAKPEAGSPLTPDTAAMQEHLRTLGRL